MKKYVLASLLIHSLIVAILVINRDPAPVYEPKPVTFEIVEPKAGPPSLSGAHAVRGGRKNSLKSILPDTSFKPGSGGKAGSEVGSGSGEWSADDWGIGGAKFKHIETYGELERLMTQLDGLFYFPGVFYDRKISGAVLARLFFLPAGGCDWTRIKIFPGERHIRVYVMALLKKACAFEDIKKMKLRTSDHADISFNLVFKTIDEFNPPPPRIVGNVILLERQAVYSPTKIPLGPIALFDGLSLISVDFMWLFRNWDHLTGGKDPLDQFK